MTQDSSAQDLRTRKRELRKKLTQALKDFPKSQKAEANALIEKSFLSLEKVRSSRTVFAYVSFEEEVNTHGILRELIKNRIKLGVPKISPELGTLEIREIQSLEKDLIPSQWGIQEPRPETKVIPFEEIDLVIVPGLGFDKNGNRLGRGKAYYDKILKKINRKTPRIALAYDFQVLQQIPVESHDEKIDLIITSSSQYTVK